MGQRDMSRRGLLKGAVSATSAGLVSQRLVRASSGILGANDRISVGIVGPGNRGNRLMEWIQRLARSQNVAMTAVCDLWEKRRETGAQRVADWTQSKPYVCRNLDELCELDDVDAVVLATPDFQHAPQTRQAVEAGKDVYVEKPLGCDFEQIKRAREAVRRTGRIVQAGTQRRAEGLPWAARRFIADGNLGKVSFIEMAQPLFHERWRIPGSENALTADETDWARYLSYNPKVPFNARHYLEFRLFWPYSTGIFCQWMSHIVDLVNLVLDERPMAVTATGGVYVWQDGRTNADTAQCLVEYASGRLFSYHMRLGNAADPKPLQFYGTQGTLDLFAGVAYGDGGGGELVLRNPSAKNPEYITNASRRLPDRKSGGVLLEPEPDIDHMADFFEAVRSRRQPRADIDAAYNHALATTMAGMALRTGVRQVYDPVDEVVRPSHPVSTIARNNDEC